MLNKVKVWLETPALKRAFDACRAHLGYTLLFSAAINLIYLAPALYMLQVYDRVLQSGSLWTLVFLSVVLVFSLGVMAFLETLRLRLFAASARRLDRLTAPLILDQTMRTGGPVPGAPTAALQAFDVFRNAITGAPALALVDAPWVPIYVIVCFMIHPWVGVLALIGGAALIGLAWWNEARLRPLLKSQEQTSAISYALIGGDAAKAETARAMGMVDRVVARQMHARESYSTAGADAAIVSSGFTAATKFLRMILQSAALGLGAYLALQQQISAGAIVAASILVSRALAPLEQVVTAWRQTGQALQAFQTFRDLLNKAPLTPREPMALPAPKGEVSVENVGVAAPTGGRILSGVSFKVQPGEVLGVVGPSGAGKSTLARVLVGAIPSDVGVVRVDGAKLSDWPAQTLGDAIGYLAQDVGLFSGTVAENIARFAPPSAARDEAVVAAAMAANVHAFILSLPKAYDTMLGPGGRGLSAGQSQRIGLARALYGKPKILVLDEPNAHLDTEGEMALSESLSKAKADGAAVVLISHRPGALKIMDRILVMKDGEIEGIGPRDPILRRMQQASGVRQMTPQAGQTPQAPQATPPAAGPGPVVVPGPSIVGMPGPAQPATPQSPPPSQSSGAKGAP